MLILVATDRRLSFQILEREDIEAAARHMRLHDYAHLIVVD